MNILAVDDEPLMLWQLTENLKRIFEKPEYRVSGFDEVDDVMEWLDCTGEGIYRLCISGYQAAWDVRN